MVFRNVLISDCTISTEECLESAPITIKKGTTKYGPITLEYRYATSTGTDGYGKVDFSKMNEENHALTLDGEGKATGTNVYVETKLNLPDAIADSKYVTVETTLKFNGNVGFWSHRFGIKMAQNKGIGVTVLPSDWGDPRLQVFGLYEENANDAFAGWSDTYTQYYDAVAAALNGKGLKLRIVRSDTQIIQYAYIDGAWVQLGDAVTCDTNAKTDIRFLVCDGSWTVGNIEYGTLEYVDVKVPQIGVSGYYAHLRAKDGTLYTVDGLETTEEAITIAAFTEFDLALTINAKKDGTTSILPDGTVVVLHPEIGESVEGTIRDGKIEAKLLFYGAYKVTAGDFVGTLSVAKESLPTEMTLEYNYATSTGNSRYGEIDFSKMNDANHALTLDGRGKATGTNVYVEAKLNLPDSVANSKYVLMETTVKFNGNVGYWSHRFGIKMTENSGIGMTVLPSDWGDPRLQVFGLYAENANDVFAGWSNTYTYYYAKVVEALNGDGLPLRLLRVDSSIMQYAYLDGEWVQLGEVSCDWSMNTDIRFLACDGSWTLDNTVFGTLEYVRAKAPRVGVQGNRAHLRAEDGTLYTTSGFETTKSAITIAALEEVELELAVNGKKDGTTKVLPNRTVVVLSSKNGDSAEGTITDGKLSVRLLKNCSYTVTAGDYEGTLSVSGSSLPTEMTLEYRYATSTGTDGYGKVDFSKMNEGNHALTLDGLGGATGTNVYVETKLNLPDAIASSKYVTVETTLKFNGNVGLWSHRFGIKMTENKGVGVTVLPSDAWDPRLQVFELYKENGNVFDGWSNTFTQYYAKVVETLNGNGLQLRIVRSDTQILQYAYLNNAWVQFGPAVTCDTNANTDIRFLICDGSWTFSNTSYEINSFYLTNADPLTLDGNGQATSTGKNDNYCVETKLDIPDAIANSKYVTVEATLKFNGGADDAPWWRRCGIKITESDGLGLLYLNGVNPFELYGNPDVIFANEVGIVYPDYNEAVIAALTGEGLKLRIVRSDAQIIQYAYLNNVWVQFGPVVACDANANTDIRFLVCDGSWTLGNIVISYNT